MIRGSIGCGGVMVCCGLVLGGDLNPPAGPVNPTHKTLTEVEPRIAINGTNTPGDATALFVISQPGSYYLTGNITGEAGKHGIVITALGVSIDLMGFQMLGVPGSGAGIISTGAIATTVRNGHVYTWGGDGVHLEGNSLIVENIISESNGGWGIFLNSNYPGSRITGCSVGQNTLGGITAAQAGLVERCVVYFHPSAPGIVGSSATRIERCVLWNCNPGIQFLFNFGGGGAFDNSMFGCPVGILASGTSARFERNIISTTQTSHVGLRATIAGNDFIDNIVYGSGDHYDFAVGNRLRLILTKIPESIDWPAHVTLAGTLFGTSGQHGITVNADDVTIDLGGHALQGIGGSLNGITVAGLRRNTAVLNGVVADWGQTGVNLASTANGSVIDVRVNNNGSNGIHLGTRSVAERCHAHSNSNVGILANNGGSVVRDCQASFNSIGVQAGFGAIVEGCFLQRNSSRGILAQGGQAVFIRNNAVFETSGAGTAGIRVESTLCRVEANAVTSCTTGYDVTSSQNLIIRNSAANCTTAFNIAANNGAGPVITVSDVATNTSPHANFRQ